MKRFLPKNNFDNFFRDKYKKHTIAPENELWENINSRMNKKKLTISLRKIRQFKIAVTILAFALIGSLTIIITNLFKKENTTIDLQEQTISDLPAETKSEKPLNPVYKVNLSNQEEEEQQDIQEIDSVEVILPQETDNNIIDNINSSEVTSK